MGINEGFSAQSTDLPLTKVTFGCASVAAGAPIVTITPGYGLGLAAVVGAPAFGSIGARIEMANPNYPTNLTRVGVQFVGSANGSDALITVKFQLFVQRNTPNVVPANTPPTFSIPPLAPVLVSVGGVPLGAGTGAPSGSAVGTNAPISVAQLAGPTPTLGGGNFATTPWQTQPGDVYYMEAVFSAALTGSITNIMVSVS